MSNINTLYQTATTTTETENSSRSNVLLQIIQERHNSSDYRLPVLNGQADTDPMFALNVSLTQQEIHNIFSDLLSESTRQNALYRLLRALPSAFLHSFLNIRGQGPEALGDFVNLLTYAMLGFSVDDFVLAQASLNNAITVILAQEQVLPISPEEANNAISRATSEAQEILNNDSRYFAQYVRDRISLISWDTYARRFVTFGGLTFLTYMGAPIYSTLLTTLGSRVSSSILNSVGPQTQTTVSRPISSNENPNLETVIDAFISAFKVLKDFIFKG